jgi:putative addiction module component (TIGR02574 family)
MAAPATLLDAVLSLPEADRAEVALAAIESLDVSLDATHDDAVDEAWSAEIARRVDDLRSGRVKPIPMDQALADARAKLRAARG